MNGFGGDTWTVATLDRSNGSPVNAWSITSMCASSTAPRRVDVDAGHLELLGAVPRTGDGPHPAATQMVEDHQLLGDPDRVVQRQDDAPRARTGIRSVAPDDRRRRGDRRGQPAVVEAVVLRDHREVEAVLVGPAELLHRSRVDVGLRRRAVDRRPEVVPHREEGIATPFSG